MFKSGKSANPGGRPKGSYSVLGIITKALEDEGVKQEAIEQVKAHLRSDKRVLPMLEFAARVNKEIGLGSDEGPRRPIVHIHTNLKPGELRRRAEEEDRRERLELGP